MSKKYNFNFKVELTEKQLDFIGAQSGADLEAKDYFHLLAEKCETPIGSSPFWAAGLGCEINTILSLGFQVWAKINGETEEFEFDPQEIFCDPMLYNWTKIEKVEYTQIPQKVNYNVDSHDPDHLEKMRNEGENEK